MGEFTKIWRGHLYSRKIGRSAFASILSRSLQQKDWVGVFVDVILAVERLGGDELMGGRVRAFLLSVRLIVGVALRAV